MEKDTNNQQAQNQVGETDAIFGMSSDAITEGLHQGAFIDDKDQIVNEQEQLEIVNPAEEEFKVGIPPEAPEKEVTAMNKPDEDLPLSPDITPKREAGEEDIIVSGEK